MRLIAYALVLLLAGCAASPVHRAETYAAQDQWLDAVMEYREAYSKNPNSIELRSGLRQIELDAANFYYHQGRNFREQGETDAAIASFQQGLMAKRDDTRLHQALRDILAQREADSLYREGLNSRQLGRLSEARRFLQEALEVYPEHEQTRQALAVVVGMEAMASPDALAASSHATTLNFRATPLRRAMEYLAGAYDLNVIFDEDVDNTPVTLLAENVTFRQALSLMLATTGTFYKRIGSNTILIAPDTSEKRAQYEDHVLRTFHLTTAGAKQVADIIKGILTPNKLVINEELNTITIRDTEAVLTLCERLIRWNDLRPAEVVLDVEILEINRNKAEQLGLDFGSQAGITFPEFQVSGSMSDALRQGIVTLPAMTLRYFKQDVDAETLANPKVRTLNNREATIHIGDRIPLRSSTILDATGQVRTTFEYRDVGIKFRVLPVVHLDNSLTVDLHLEVSTLGQNLGTVDEPAFSIGTRNANTYMLLRDGETAVLGGLIRDEDRRARARVPGLGDIPLLGMLFTQYDDATTRTDILLTITPRVIRGWSLPPQQERSLYSGTESRYGVQQTFAYLQEFATDGGPPRIRLGGDGAPPETGSDSSEVRPPVATNVPAPAESRPLLAFGQPIYAADAGGEITVDIVGRNLDGLESVPLAILYNPEVLGLTRVASAAAEAVRGAAEAPGVARILLTGIPQDAGDEQVLARLNFAARDSGISYLLYRDPRLTTGAGNEVEAEVRASRVRVR